MNKLRQQGALLYVPKRFEQARTVADVQGHLQESIRELLMHIAPERLRVANIPIDNRGVPVKIVYFFLTNV